MNWAEFCLAMRAERERQGLSTGKLAVMMGTSQSSVCDRESARHGPSLPGVAQWGEALKVEVFIEIERGQVDFALTTQEDLW